MNELIRDEIDANGVYLQSCFKYFHDSYHLNRRINKLVLNEFCYSSDGEAIEKNVKILIELKHQYELLDKNCQLTQKSISEYINVEI